MVYLNDHGGIPEPITMCVGESPGQGCNVLEDRGFMRTIRIPVGEFGAVNDVRNIYLQFLSGAVGDEFIVDNLEFADGLFFNF